MKISVCIATYRRAEKLAALLEDLAQQTRLPDEVVVVDNDAQATAQPVVQRCREPGAGAAPAPGSPHAPGAVPGRMPPRAPFALRYAVQPLKNISLTRNRTVELASGEWLAFIDDDERAPPQWLERLIDAALRLEADGVLAPVDPIVPGSAPGWIRRGRFYDFPRMPTGTVIPPNRLRFGNVLLRGAVIRALPEPPFDPAYGLTGGEDGDLLSRLVQQGLRLVWCDEAIVHEPVEQTRLSLRWLLRRALSGGQDFARHTLTGRYGKIATTGRAKFLVRALVQALAAALLALFTWPMGRHVAAKWLIKVSANLGKISAFSRWRYREYA